MSLPAVPWLCAVTASHRLVTDSAPPDRIAALTTFLDQVIDEGVDLVLVREPDLPHDVLVTVVRAAVRRATGGVTRVIVNDRVQVALEAVAHGVHLKAASAPLGNVRDRPATWIVGRSAHELADLRDRRHPRPAGDFGVEHLDYWLFGTMFATASKPEVVQPAGVAGLGPFVAQAGLPVMAIGGITPSRVGECIAAGASGVAAITPFLPMGSAPAAVGVRAAVAAFREALAAAVAR